MVGVLSVILVAGGLLFAVFYDSIVGPDPEKPSQQSLVEEEQEEADRKLKKEIEALEKAVDHAQTTGRPLLVATHHPLMPVDCAWLDEIGAENAREALQRLAPLGEKAVVISGHVHQDAAQTYHGVQCLTVPSTCIQFAPNSADFQLDAEAPGCRMLTLHESGEWETAVLRVTDETFAVDLNSPGYA